MPPRETWGPPLRPPVLAPPPCGLRAYDATVGPQVTQASIGPSHGLCTPAPDVAIPCLYRSAARWPASDSTTCPWHCCAAPEGTGVSIVQQHLSTGLPGATDHHPEPVRRHVA